MSLDPKERFSDRAADYARWRPGYPDGLVDAIAETTGLNSDWTVADLGSGTGLSSRPFLDRGYRVLGVEPNAEMRAAAESSVGNNPRFTSVDGSAEATGLPDDSVDLVLAAQAFHWFDKSAVRTECLRIVRAPRWSGVVWNVRRTDADDFARAYEALLQRWGTDYVRYQARRINVSELVGFFGGEPTERVLANSQSFDYEGLRGRHLSSSYVPGPEHRDHDSMMRALQELYEAHAEGGRVHFRYDTQLFVGRMT